MMTLIFIILMCAVFGKLVAFSFRAAWGLLKVILFLGFLPLIIIALFFGGLVTLAFPILIVVGIVTLLLKAF